MNDSIAGPALEVLRIESTCGYEIARCAQRPLARVQATADEKRSG